MISQVIARSIRGVTLAVFVLSLPSQAAASATGGAALSLASLTASYSPVLSGAKKQVLARPFDRDLKGLASGKIVVHADTVACRQSDVDIAARSCVLKFGQRTIFVDGRAAHELYATLAEIGVPADGAAGTLFETLSQLTCTIDPAEIRQRSGGGADCIFTPGG